MKYATLTASLIKVLTVFQSLRDKTLADRLGVDAQLDEHCNIFLG